MEGSRGRRISMVVVVVAILVGLSSIHVGAAMGPSNCGAYEGFCFDTPQCCNSVRTLVTEDVPCFCTAIEGIDVTLIIQPIKETCGITIRPDICSNGGGLFSESRTIQISAVLGNGAWIYLICYLNL
ncbi:hypothetical protein EJ110_NYTH56259 [Nymphaea thermarum]|nr:hypothetical protein EJ110_NYTH56259 [Nymphaea thermarum]